MRYSIENPDAYMNGTNKRNIENNRRIQVILFIDNYIIVVIYRIKIKLSGVTIDIISAILYNRENSGNDNGVFVSL